MSVLSQKIKDLFNYLSTHFHDDFSRLSATTLSKYLEHLDVSLIVNSHDNIEPSYKNLSSLIEKIFEKQDFLTCGENAIAFVNFVKSNSNKLSDPKFMWISSSLAEFCKAAITTTNSHNLIVEETVLNNESNSNFNPSLNSDSSSNSNDISNLISSLRNDINTDVQTQLLTFMRNSMSKSVKDEHYQDLEELLNRKVKHNNSLTVNKQYHSNKVFQSSIHKSRFPKPWIPDDPIFVDKFDKLISKFQTEIQEFNINFIEEKAQVLNKDITSKLDFMNNIDNNAKDKCNALEAKITALHNQSLIKSTEKVNRLIVAAKSSDDDSTDIVANFSSNSVNTRLPLENKTRKNWPKNNKQSRNLSNNSQSNLSNHNQMEPLIQTQPSHLLQHSAFNYPNSTQPMHYHSALSNSHAQTHPIHSHHSHTTHGHNFNNHSTRSNNIIRNK